MIDPEDGCGGDADDGHEGVGAAVVTGVDAPPVFEPAEHDLDFMALANGIGQARGGRNSKVHAVCDGKRRPCVLLITPGNVHDMRVAKRCIAAMPPSAELFGDKACDSNDLRQATF